MGPLEGLRVLEVASAAPGPFACMVLGDLGAEVTRIDRSPRSVGAASPPVDPLLRNRSSIALDLKAPGAAEVVLRLVAQTDVLVEGFRPGVMERLGLGPSVCLEARPELIYARMTGWGQEGPLAPRAGHDLNYIAVAGALDPIGRSEGGPVPPLNLVGDFGGGGMLLAVGILAALHERQRSGRGQVVDAAMIDGAALLTASLHGMLASGDWTASRSSNLLDGGAPFYDTYETADGRYLAVAPLEGRFYAQLIRGLGLEAEDLPARLDPANWPTIRSRFTEIIKQRTRDDWERVFEGQDACVTPVLAPSEAASHPHVRERDSFVDVGGHLQPAPAPRFSRSVLAAPEPSSCIGVDTWRVLRSIGLDEDELDRLATSGVVPPEPVGVLEE